MGDLPHRLASAAGRTLGTLVDLVLPATCGGCGAERVADAVCDVCLAVLHEQPGPTRPTPAPAGLPECVAGGEYTGVLRDLILAYKEHGRRDLVRPLGSALARVVLAGWPAPRAGPLALVPVPATAAAIRARHGDHMLRLARIAVDKIRREGLRATVVPALRALPKADSAHLDRAERAAAARMAFRVRQRARVLGSYADAGAVILLDDVLTTGATLSAASLRLLEAGVPVTFAATLAATRLRHGAPRAPIA